MTCIAAVHMKNGKLLMAADSRLTAVGDEISQVLLPKIIKKNNIILAGCGDYDVVYLLTHGLKVTKKAVHISSHDYLYSTFMDKVKKTLSKSGYYINNTLTVTEDIETDILIGIEKQVYMLSISKLEHSGLINISPVSTPYFAGSGAPYALGAYKVLENYSGDTKANLRTALEVAAKCCNSCDDKIVLEIGD